VTEIIRCNGVSMTEDERQALITYLENRMCQEYRTGQPCRDGPAGGRLQRSGPHPACVKAAEMIEIVERA
jgi:hypothetical protein